MPFGRLKSVRIRSGRIVPSDHKTNRRSAMPTLQPYDNPRL